MEQVKLSMDKYLMAIYLSLGKYQLLLFPQPCIPTFINCNSLCAAVAKARWGGGDFSHLALLVFCDPLLCTVNHPKFIVLKQMEEGICIKRMEQTSYKRVVPEIRRLLF